MKTDLLKNHKKSISRNADKYLKNKIYILYLFFIFFPFIKLFDFGSDMQPNALLIALLLIPMFKLKLSLTDLYLGLVFLFSIFLLILSGFNFTALRSFFNYLSLFFISYISFKVLKSENINFEKCLRYSILIWFIIGFIQVLYRKTFLNFLVSSARTTENRGVIGFAPEPTFYGMVCVFFILFLSHGNDKNKGIYIFISIFCILFFAKSSLAIVFLFILMLFYLILYFNYKYLIYSIISLLVFPLLILKYLNDTRIAFLFNKFIENPKRIVLTDASINDRIFHIFFSLKGFIDHYLLPAGFNSWKSYASNEIVKYSNYVILEWFSLGGRIMSGLGSVLFELGIFGLLIPISVLRLLFYLYKNSINHFIFYSLSIIAIMLSAIPIGFSFFGFYIGYLRYLLWKNRYNIN